MPLEIHLSERLLRKPLWKPTVTSGKGFGPRPNGAASPSKPLPPKFRFQHDLESLWWIAVWFLLCRVRHPKALVVADDVFTEDDYPTKDRKDFFTNEAFVGDFKRIIPEKFFFVVESLENIRGMLYFSYADESFSGDRVMFNPATYSDIYNIAWLGFQILATKTQETPFNFDDPTSSADDANKTILQKRPRSQPKPRPDDDYEPGADSDEEQDSDEVGDDITEPEAKRSKVELRRRQMGP